MFPLNAPKGTVIKALMMTNRNVFFILEQPAQSFAFKLPMFRDLTEQLQMCLASSFAEWGGVNIVNLKYKKDSKKISYNNIYYI